MKYGDVEHTKYILADVALDRISCIIELSGGKHRNGRIEKMNPMSRHISDYVNKLKLPYSVRDNSFTLEIIGEEYTIKRYGIRHW